MTIELNTMASAVMRPSIEGELHRAGESQHPEIGQYNSLIELGAPVVPAV